MNDRIFLVGNLSIMFVSMVVALCWSQFNAPPWISGVALVMVPTFIFGWTHLCNRPQRPN